MKNIDYLAAFQRMIIIIQLMCIVYALCQLNERLTPYIEPQTQLENVK